MKKYAAIFLISLASVLQATPMCPSLTGSKGLYHLISADNGYAGVFYGKLSTRIFTSDWPVFYASMGGIDSSLNAIDTYFGGDFDFAASMAFTDFLEVNVRGRYLADYIDCADQVRAGVGLARDSFPIDWYYQGWENRASIDRGDMDIGIKFIPTGFADDPAVDFAIYPFVSLATGIARDTSLYRASYFQKRTVSNHGGVFRYFTNGTVAPGAFLLLSGSTRTPSPLSGYLNLGYQYKGDASEVKYGVGADAVLFNFFDPFVEFWGNYRLKDFGDNLPSYVTLGLKFITTGGMSLDFGYDILVIGKKEYDFRDFIPADIAEAAANNIATGPGMRPTWAFNFALGFAYDFYRMRPVTNKGMIVGRVIDAVTQKGIDAIIVPTGAPKTISEPLGGGYEIETRSDGKVQVTALKEGYSEKSEVVAVSRGGRTTLNFELMPKVSKASLLGRVSDKWTTLPLANAKISISPAQKTAYSSKTGSSYKPISKGITTTIDGEEYVLNVSTGKWEKTGVVVGDTDAGAFTTPAYDPNKLKDSTAVTSKDGLYKLDSIPAGKYIVTASFGDYVAQSSPIVCKPGETEVLNFEMLGETIVLYGIHFEFDSANIFPDSYILLDKVVKFLTDNSSINVEIGGHTDWVADDAYNMDLSQRRAESVRRYLIAHGISPTRLTAKGYGKTKFITDNVTDEGRALNRRIELKILNKKAGKGVVKNLDRKSIKPSKYTKKRR